MKNLTFALATIFYCTMGVASEDSGLLNRPLEFDCGNSLNIKETLQVYNAAEGSFYPLRAILTLRGKDQTTGVIKAQRFEMEGNFETEEFTGQKKDFGPGIVLSQVNLPQHQFVIQRKLEIGQKAKAERSFIRQVSPLKLERQKYICELK
jgi:hypothetical protein